MSTRYNEEKYRRYAEKFRANLLRDFPNLQVIIKAGSQQAELTRMGCFEIWFFNKYKGIV